MVFTMIFGNLNRAYRKISRTRKRRVSALGLIGLISILALSTVGFYFLESGQNLSLFDSLWLSVVTMTTVGYGDTAPLSTAGRIFGMMITMTGGIGLVAYLVTLIASTFIEWENGEMNGLAKIKAVGHILIVNCPNEDKVLGMVEQIRKNPRAMDVPIVLISEELESIPEQFVEIDDFYFVRGNPLLHRILERANASEASKAIILARDTKDPNSDGLTTQVALTLEHLHSQAGKSLYTVAEAVSRDSIPALKAAEVEEVICHEELMPPILTQALLNPGIEDLKVGLLSHTKGYHYFLGKVGHLKGRKYQDLLDIIAVRPELKIVPIGLSRDDEPIIGPGRNTTVDSDDMLIYLAFKRYDLAAFLADS